MSLYRLTPAARHDLSRIWDYTEDQWGADQADRYIEDIRTAIERVASTPDRGQACDEIRAGYRVYPTGKHLIFYLWRDASIDIIRILHQRIDPTQHP